MYSQSCLPCANGKQKKITADLLQETFEFRSVRERKPIQCDDVKVILEPVTCLRSETATPRNIDVSLISKTIRGSRYCYVISIIAM